MSLKKERNRVISLVPVVLPGGHTGGVREFIFNISFARYAVLADQRGEIFCG